MPDPGDGDDIAASAGLRDQTIRFGGAIAARRVYAHCMRTTYLEGRCKECGQRVTVERAAQHHRGLDGQPCGPVETHRPGSGAYEMPGRPWVAPKRGEGHAA